MKTINAITPRTDAEWPQDHPLRAVSRVMTPHEVSKLRAYLVCSIVGEPRLPPAPDDEDVTTECSLCPREIVHRKSAPKKLNPICWRCWEGIAVT